VSEIEQFKQQIQELRQTVSSQKKTIDRLVEQTFKMPAPDLNVNQRRSDSGCTQYEDGDKMPAPDRNVMQSIPIGCIEPWMMMALAPLSKTVNVMSLLLTWAYFYRSN